jgi:hypothetical protein
LVEGGLGVFFVGAKAYTVGAEPAPVMVRHHGIPREIIKKQPPAMQKAIRGKKGQPNIVEVEEEAHKAAHNGWNGKPKYNEEFQRRLDALGRPATAADYRCIRADMLKEYFGH